MRRDVDRTEIPGGSVYNMVDFIPDEIQAVIGGRGGWTYADTVLSGSLLKIAGLGYHPVAESLIAVVLLSGTGYSLYEISSGAILYTDAGNVPRVDNPVYHRGKLIFTGANVGTNPLYFDGTTAALLSAAPNALYATVYKDHTVIANDTSTHSNRVWFSAAGDPTTWDTTFGWWDTTGDVTGLASVLNGILVFHGDSTERLRGTTPPPGSDMALEPFLPTIGCIDPHSIAYWQNRLIFAASQGIYLTDGVSNVDLTANAQMKTYWQSLMSGYSSSWRIAGGVYRDHYIISINNGNSLVDCLCVSLSNQTMWRFTNLHGS